MEIKSIKVGCRRSENYNSYEVTLEGDFNPDVDNFEETIRELQARVRRLVNLEIKKDEVMK